MDSLTFTIDLKDINDPEEPQQVVDDLKLLFRFLMNANPNYYLVGNMLYEQLNKQLEPDPKIQMQEYLDSIAPDIIDGRVPDLNAAYCYLRSEIGEAMGPVCYAAHLLAQALKKSGQSSDWVWDFVKYYEDNWEF